MWPTTECGGLRICIKSPDLLTWVGSDFEKHRLRTVRWAAKKRKCIRGVVLLPEVK
jgi:hypothetical protein